MYNNEYVKNVMLSILKEEAKQNDVIDAIKKKYEVAITYDDGANGIRRIQPMAYGKSKSGNLVIRAYQPEGDSKSDSSGWKFFRLDRIGAWNPMMGRHFSEPPDTYNANGDNSMSEVYLTADFGNSSNNYDTYQQDSEHNSPVSNRPQIQQQPQRTAVPQPQQPVQQQVSKIAGIGAEPQTKGNMQSVRDMSKANNFGDNTTTQTVGPVMKGNTEDTVNADNKVDYSVAINNGPRFKADNGNDTDNIDRLNYVDDNEEETNNRL